MASNAPDPAADAKAAFAAGDFETAAALFTVALTNEPHSVALICNRAAAWLAAGRAADALADAQRAIALEPSAAKAHQRAGQALLALDQPHESAAAFTAALRLDADNAVCQDGLRESVERMVRAREAKREAAYAAAAAAAAASTATDAAAAVAITATSPLASASNDAAIGASVGNPIASASLPRARGRAPQRPAADASAPNRKRKREPEPGPPPATVRPPPPPGECCVRVCGLPRDVTIDELVAFAARCGMVHKHSETIAPLVLLDSERGEATLKFFQAESVPMALDLLDESWIRSTHRVSLTRATPAQTAELMARFAERPLHGPAAMRARVYDQGRELAWDNAAERGTHLPTIVTLKHCFDPRELVRQRGLADELRDDIASECARFGPVVKVIVFDTNPDGVVSVTFEQHKAAAACVHAMQGRWFDGRQLVAEFWDRVVRYRVAESDELAALRLDAFAADAENGEPPGTHAASDGDDW